MTDPSSQRSLEETIRQLPADQQQEVAEVVNEVTDVAAERSGEFHFEDAVDRIVEVKDYQREQAKSLLRSLYPFDERGFAYIRQSAAIDAPTGTDGDLKDLDQPAGAKTDDMFRSLHILEAPESGHPLIPNINEYFERDLDGTDSTDVDVLCQALSDPDFSPLLVGEAGTGKDTLVKYVCTQTNRPVIRVNFGSDVRYENLVGMFILNEEGQMEWIDGALTKAVRYGWVFIADELNAAPPEATMPLHQVTEEEGDAGLFLREKSESITPHPQFRFVATMNPPSTHVGTNRLNEAFRSRFYTIQIDYLNPEREAELLAKQNSEFDSVSDAEIEQLAELAARLRELYKQGDITTPITTRELIKTCKMAEIMSTREAAELVLTGHAQENDEDVIEDLIHTFF